MNRRDFLITSATATTALALGARAASPALPGSANDLLRDIIRANDAQIPALLARQERTPGHRWIGGLTNSHGLATVADTNGFVAALACAASAFAFASSLTRMCDTSRCSPPPEAACCSA